MNDNGFFNRSDKENDGKLTFGKNVVKPMGGFDRIVAVFAAPNKLFENLRVYPKIFAPFVIFLIMGIVSGVLTIRYEQMAAEARRPEMEARYGEEFAALLESGSDYSLIFSANRIDSFSASAMMAVSGILAFLSTYGFSGISTALIYYAAVKLFKGDAAYPKILSMVFHTLIVSVIGGTLSLMLGVILSTPVDVFSPAVFLGLAGFETDLYNILASVSLFSVWHFVLTIFGLRAICSISLKKAAVISSILFLAGILFAGVVAPVIDGYTLDSAYQMFLEQA